MEAEQRLAPHTTIVRTLREYGDSSPELLGHVLGIGQPELDALVAGLETDGVVVRAGDKLRLVEKRPAPQGV